MLGRYGWYHLFMEACGRDITKLDAITEKSAWEIFTYMTYLIDYNYVERTKLQRTYR